jgi:hypothetical protein
LRIKQIKFSDIFSLAIVTAEIHPFRRLFRSPGLSLILSGRCGGALGREGFRFVLRLLGLRGGFRKCLGEISKSVCVNTDEKRFETFVLTAKV